MPGPPPPLHVSSGTWFSDTGNELPGGGEGGGRYAHQCADNTDQRYLAGLVRVALEEARLLGDDMTVPSTAVYGIRDTVGTGPQAVHEDRGGDGKFLIEENVVVDKESLVSALRYIGLPHTHTCQPAAGGAPSILLPSS